MFELSGVVTSGWVGPSVVPLSLGGLLVVSVEGSSLDGSSVAGGTVGGVTVVDGVVIFSLGLETAGGIPTTREEGGSIWSQAMFSLSLSLAHTHTCVRTHTHTHTQTQRTSVFTDDSVAALQAVGTGTVTMGGIPRQTEITAPAIFIEAGTRVDTRREPQL